MICEDRRVLNTAYPLSIVERHGVNRNINAIWKENERGDANKVACAWFEGKISAWMKERSKRRKYLQFHPRLPVHSSGSIAHSIAVALAIFIFDTHWLCVDNRWYRTPTIKTYQKWSRRETAMVGAILLEDRADTRPRWQEKMRWYIQPRLEPSQGPAMESGWIS